MKNAFVVVLVLVLMCAGGNVMVAAATTTIDFEGFTYGTVVSGPGVFSDLIFSYGPDAIFVYDSIPGPQFGGSKCAYPDPFEGSTSFRADFLLTGVESVSVVIGDWNQDADDLFLKAYSSSFVLLDEDAFALPGDTFGGEMLSVSGSDIAYVLFGNTGAYPNSVAFDNFSYTAGTPDVPEPMSMMLGIMGLGSVAGLRRLRGK